jgi:carotenoid 1,2-hydratase
LIAFVGSVFSPYYAWARRRGAADPLDHCAFNVALYGAQARWAMTERGVKRVQREPASLRIGPSAMRFTGGTLKIDIDEICAPLPRRVRGSVVVTPSALCDRSYVLEERGAHRWTPFAPCARIDVRLDHPAQRWQGVAYFDSNSGDEPLENGFESWTWSRAALPDGAAVLYDVTPRVGAARSLGLKFDHGGAVQEIEPPPPIDLRRSGWRVERRTRADAGRGASVKTTLEDAPFYSRSLLDTHVCGSPALAIHESLSLDRFRAPWVQCLLPFRMPRRR